MGQYFKAVNLDKQEYVCPWCVGGIAKLWEWSVNPWGAVFTLLLRKSSEGGGGDFYGYHNGHGEGTPVHTPDGIVGRWAGDRIVLVGDYDQSRLWEQLPRYRNISKELVDVWNPYIEIENMKLKWNPDCGCNQVEPDHTPHYPEESTQTREDAVMAAYVSRGA